MKIISLNLFLHSQKILQLQVNIYWIFYALGCSTKKVVFSFDFQKNSLFDFLLSAIFIIDSIAALLLQTL